ncbi:bifunctional metallophosphatase/5'-nucleotidase [Negadavirga shengliensis]|uniref:Bifunctional metallophosphatase/5'-nucleotidase n=1 Tax=Negadavirga shengliensis TaxID=1389218 RepID=A0ABV9SZA0_9BACT
MNRRVFIKKSLITSATIAAAGPLTQAMSPPKSRHICILHTNDMHSRIEPFPDDGSSFANQGGMAKRASVIRKIRSEEKNVLLLDAGDIFQGTPYFNLYGGELEFKLMSELGYDAATLGNHDFDNGLEGLKEQLPHAGFSFLCSNYDFKKTVLKDEFRPYQVFHKGGLAVGVFGLGIALDGLVPAQSYGETAYLDPVAVAREMVQELKSKKCDLVVCLSHLGFSYKSQKIDDQKLAAQVEGIDLVIGGHTHTFLDEPVTVEGPHGYPTLVNQAGWSGLRLGMIKYEFSRKKNLKKAITNNLAIK